MYWSDLPELALIRVLNCLTVQDLLNARLVCRHWKLISDSSVQRNELILFVEIYPRPVYWFHDGSEVDLDNAFMISNLDAIKNEFLARNFSRVRRLMIVQIINLPTRRFLEQTQIIFMQLEHLQFTALGRNWFTENEIYETNLTLPNLRTLYLQLDGRPSGFHCPKLTELSVYSDLTIDDKTDEKTRSCIQNLKLLRVYSLLSYPNRFKFTNLEILYFSNPSSSIRLSDFPRLKEIHYFYFHRIYLELRDHLANLLEQKRSLKKDQLRIYFDGFKLEADLETLNNYIPTADPQDNLPLNVPVLRLIKESPSLFKFNLLSKDLLMSDAVDDELIDLPQGNAVVKSMFKSIFEILFNEAVSKDSPNLFDLSDRFRYVSYVSFSVEPSQTLLDRLPDAFPHLVEFGYFPTFFSKEILNFQFLTRFKSLHKFQIHSAYRLISIEELRSIFEKCKFINWFCFGRPNKAFVRVERSIGSKIFFVDWSSTNNVSFARAWFTVEELLDYLEESRWLEKNNFLGEKEEAEPAPLNLRPRFAAANQEDI